VTAEVDGALNDAGRSGTAGAVETDGVEDASEGATDGAAVAVTPLRSHGLGGEPIVVLK
jgi:hypothetical protein